MSADNFIAIVKQGREYVGYHCWASHDYVHIKCYSCLGTEHFRETTLLKAYAAAEKEELLEYGFRYAGKETEIPKGTYVCPCALKIAITTVPTEA